ncbi:protein of unknown function [Propionibacterium cyclohexanicum]|uniref:DUF349 domain-containing protein n=1 Tax=Propionibacterium cyclohexanicum TaxID=64702 RepID=A0A1H9Q300_9ACTN|nr:DUF349 domain-containing protein [Propionibacterium cyclohexanicum]SER54788.1 protein of unknown function [Propionibacterium cyclohexanicum]
MSDSAGPTTHGRVDPDGTVYVITSAGERRVGQVPDVSPDEALAFFTRRFTALETESSLLRQRVQSGSVAPDEARKQINALKRSIAEANAVGDLEALAASLEDLAPVVEGQLQERRQARQREHERTREAKEAMVAQAEKLAQGTDWRGGVSRFRELLEQWKALPRIDKATDDELWHRFSSARTVYTRRRKVQFAQQAEERDDARKVKEEIIREAEGLAGSTDWGETARDFRDLMTRWKAAGPAPRDVDEKLWERFRSLQDTFFEARKAALAEQDEEFRGNQQAKEALLDEAEKSILPVGDVAKARSQLRAFLEKFNAYGRVPRDALRSIDARVRDLEQAVKTAEENEWKRTDPEARRRAADTVEMFSAQIDKLSRQAEAAQGRGDTRKASQLRDSIDTYRGWLEQARKALDEFSA